MAQAEAMGSGSHPSGSVGCRAQPSGTANTPLVNPDRHCVKEDHSRRQMSRKSLGQLIVEQGESCWDARCSV